VPTVKLGLDQRADGDPVHGDVDNLAVDVHVDQFDAAHRHAAHVHAPEQGIGEITGKELGAGQVGAVEPRSAQIGSREVGHEPTVSPPTDSRRDLRPASADDASRRAR
jgi:hypothetical protein